MASLPTPEEVSPSVVNQKGGSEQRGRGEEFPGGKEGGIMGTRLGKASFREST